MSNTDYRNQIHDRLRGKQYLLPVYHSVLNIPERVREFDSSMFVVLNTKSQRFEVHSLDNIGNTFCVAVGFNDLDERLINMLYKGNVRTRGKAILEEIDLHNEKLKASRERSRRNDLEAIASEMRSSFAKVAWS
jgi:hypothetical protein